MQGSLPGRLYSCETHNCGFLYIIAWILSICLCVDSYHVESVKNIKFTSRRETLLKLMSTYILCGFLCARLFSILNSLRWKYAFVFLTVLFLRESCLNGKEVGWCLIQLAALIQIPSLPFANWKESTLHQRPTFIYVYIIFGLQKIYQTIDFG